MSNPFEFFTNNDSDDEKYQTTRTEQKPKRTHAEKRIYKQTQQTPAQNSTGNQSGNTEEYPEHIKDNAKQIRNPRHPPTPLTKKLGEGHFHDRQSGTGRVYDDVNIATNPERLEEERATLETSRICSTQTNTSRSSRKKEK